MGYGIAIQIDRNKMLKAIKVNKSVEDCTKMLENYAKKCEETNHEEKYIKLRAWSFGVLQGAKMLAKGTHRKWSMYGITKDMVKGTVFENC